jgi:hypothetical protein
MAWSGHLACVTGMHPVAAPVSPGGPILHIGDANAVAGNGVVARDGEPVASVGVFDAGTRIQCCDGGFGGSANCRARYPGAQSSGA